MPDYLEKAMLRIAIKYAYFHGLLQRLTLIPSKSVNVAGVTKYGNLYYNEKRFSTMSTDDIVFVLLHELMHVVLGHVTLNLQNTQAQAYAIDIIVNALLVQEGVDPGNMYYKNTFPDMYGKTHCYNTDIRNAYRYTTVEIYNRIEKEFAVRKTTDINDTDINDIDDNDTDIDDDTDIDNDISVDDNNDTITNDDTNDDQILDDVDFDEPDDGIQVTDKTIISLREEALDTIDELHSNEVIKSLTEELKVFKKQTPKWQKNLNSFLTTSDYQYYSWSKPAKSYWSTGIYMPRLKNQSTDILFVVDISFSMHTISIERILTELIKIRDAYTYTDITVLFGGYTLCGVVKLKDTTLEDMYNIVRKREGNTSHEFMFEWIEETNWRGSHVVLYTDACSDIEECWLRYKPEWFCMFIFDAKLPSWVSKLGQVERLEIT